MRTLKRILLFLSVNLAVVLTLSILLNLFNVRPYLNQYGIDYRSLFIFCLVWGMGGALISLSLSRVMAKWMLGVKVIDPRTQDSREGQLLHLVYALAQKAHLPEMPQVGIFSSPEANAFATGPTRSRALVAVSSGLLSQMNTEQIEGVLAHEITHVVNGDMVTMALLQGVVNAFVMFLARALAFVLSGFGKNNQRRGSYGMYYVFVFLFELVFMVLGSLLVFWFSRKREFRADKGGAELAGKEKMIGALQALKRLLPSERRHQEANAMQPALETLKISTPVKSGLKALFASHPPLDERIQRLEQERF